eukprot:TRINITY_DN74750_c0_g1_i1.p1 TRINITY_DN74750_c0_g1~~TRINITY_DN74750_c0_g1_i1.p1  ORF type:complete len:370 (-),score=89.12 TRINITY_DN74750_c0_g1_i1:115-1224(-)
MFEKTLKSLQKRTSEIGNQIGTVLTGEGKEKRATHDFDDDVDAASNAFGVPVSGPVLVRYMVQNAADAADKEGAAFMLPSMAEGLVTVRMIRTNFTLPGKFYFRFKMPDQSFGGYVWVDMNDDTEIVPIIKGMVTLKALRLPDEASVGGGGAPPRAAASSCALSASPDCSPMSSSATDLYDLQMGADPSASPKTPGPQSDLMDLGSSSASSAPRRTSSAYSAPAAPPVAMPSREACVAKREAEVENRVKAAAEKARLSAEKEAAGKAAKVEFSNKLGGELDKWARTGDGQNWKDIRTLLSTVHTVIWKDSDWKEQSLADLLAPGAIKKSYRKAIILTHPDKHQDADFEQQFRADRIFNALNEAFKVSDK